MNAKAHAKVARARAECAGAWLRHCLVLVANVRVPCIVAVDTIRGWRLFSSELLIVWLVF